MLSLRYACIAGGNTIGTKRNSCEIEQSGSVVVNTLGMQSRDPGSFPGCSNSFFTVAVYNITNILFDDYLVFSCCIQFRFLSFWMPWVVNCRGKLKFRSKIACDPRGGGGGFLLPPPPRPKTLTLKPNPVRCNLITLKNASG